MIRDSVNRRRCIANAWLSSTLLMCAALLFCPLTRTSLYPACPIHQYLGIDCPGCGATRALIALLHGHPVQALRLNALFVLLLPIALACAIETYRRAIRAESFSWPNPPRVVIYATLAVTVIFTVARNVLP